jgi:hypothetical protein
MSGYQLAIITFVIETCPCTMERPHVFSTRIIPRTPFTP